MILERDERRGGGSWRGGKKRGNSGCVLATEPTVSDELGVVRGRGRKGGEKNLVWVSAARRMEPPSAEMRAAAGGVGLAVSAGVQF